MRWLLVVDLFLAACATFVWFVYPFMEVMRRL
jgi:hypothetical protein